MISSLWNRPNLRAFSVIINKLNVSFPSSHSQSVAAGSKMLYSSTNSVPVNKAAASTSDRDLVILHCVPRGKTLPNPSPFVLKLWTFLRFADIPYKLDTKKPFGPKGKSPWITINGKVVEDSQLIIEYLSKKYNKNLDKPYTAEQLAISRSVRIMLEEHMHWGNVVWRTSSEGVKTADLVWKIPKSMVAKIWINYYFFPKMKFYAWAQGMGRHSVEETQKFVLDDMRAVSNILGTKKYILGETPCSDDAGIFGILAQNIWASHGSPYEKALENEFPNLRDYCYRIKEVYWPDWNTSLAR